MRPAAHEARAGIAFRHAQAEHENRHGDGEDTVDQSLDAAFR